MQKQSWFAVSVLVLATCHQLLLCFIYTNVWRVPSSTLAFTEVGIFFACLPILLKRIPPLTVALIALVLFNFMILALLGRPIDFKAIRDLLIPIIFFWFGRNAAVPGFADRALGIIVAIVIVFGCFEFLFLAQYTKVFDIAGYFVSRGLIETSSLSWIKNGLFASGMRPEAAGRNLFPFLGNHRASSVFLEPVSLGNFAVIVAAWGIAKGKEALAAGTWFVVAAILLAVLSDSRYAVGAISVLVIMRMVGATAYLAASVLPFLALGVTVTMGIYFHSALLSDSTIGRLARSGNVLLKFNESQLLGLVRPDVSVFDAGYGYAIANFGIVLCLSLWALFCLYPMADAAGKRFRGHVSAYIALILCISGSSLFALKTAGILWFLVGSVSAGWALSNKTTQRAQKFGGAPRWHMGTLS